MTLADLGASVKLETVDGQPVVVDQIPSRVAKNQETQLFVNRMVSIARASRALVVLKQQLVARCRGFGSATSETSTATSVWSPEQGRWVDATAGTAAGFCEELRREVSEGDGVVQNALEKAASEARRGGVKESDMEEVADTLGLRLP